MARNDFYFLPDYLKFAAYLNKSKSHKNRYI